MEWTAVGARRAEIRVLPTAQLGDAMHQEASNVSKPVSSFNQDLLAISASGNAVVRNHGTKKDGGTYDFVVPVLINEVVATTKMLYVIGQQKSFKTKELEDVILQVPLTNVCAKKLLDLVAV